MSEPEFFSTFTSSPLEDEDRLAQTLREQDESPADIESLLPALSKLKTWTLPPLRAGQVQHLLARLEPFYV